MSSTACVPSSAQLGKPTPTPAVFSFEGISQGKKVRITPDSFDPEMYMSCVDYVMVICDYNNKEASNKQNEVYANNKEDLDEYIKMYQFRGIISSVHEFN